MAVASTTAMATATTTGGNLPFIDVYMPFVTDYPPYWLGSVVAAEATAATLDITCPADQCSFTSKYRVTTAESYVEWAASDSNMFTSVTCDYVSSGAACTSYFWSSTSSSNTGISTNVPSTDISYLAAYITDRASLLAVNPAGVVGSGGATVAGQTALLAEAATAATQSSSTSGSTKPAATRASTATGGSIAVQGGPSAGASAAVPADKANAAQARGVGKAVYGLGGLLAALTVAVAAL